MHQKPFGGRALPGLAGEAYSAAADPLAEFREVLGSIDGKGREMEGKEKWETVVEGGGLPPRIYGLFRLVWPAKGMGLSIADA